MPTHWLLWVLIAGYVITFGTLATREHLAFETNVLDLGNYDQAMWNAAQGRGLALTTLPNISLNRMGLHVEPTLFLLVPLYRLFPTPLTLLWVQTLALGLAAWPLFLLARRHLQNAAAALAIAAAYLLMPATQSINMFDFHAVALSPPLMLGGIYFLDRGLRKNGGSFWQRRWPGQPANAAAPTPEPTWIQALFQRDYLLAALFFSLAMGTKEDIPLHVLMVGLYVALLLRRWRLGLSIAVVGLAWATIAFGLVIPTFREAGQQSAYVAYFPTLGNSPLAIALSPLLRPGAVLALLWRPETLSALSLLIVPFAGFNLVGWPVFALAAPSLAISLLSNNPLQQELETWHYAAPMLPFVSLAAVDGLHRLITWLQRHTVQPAALLIVVLLLTSLSYQHLRGYSPLARPFHWPVITEHHRLGHRLAGEIPPAAKLLVQAELAPHVSQRQNLTIWTGPFPDEFDYIFVDLFHPRFINLDHAQAHFLGHLIYTEDFGIAVMQDGYLLLQRGVAQKELQPTLQTFLFEPPPATQSLAQFGELAELVYAEPHTYRGQEPQVTLYFRPTQRPADPHYLHLYLRNEAGEIVGATVFEQPAMIWWPPQLWQVDQTVRVRFNTLPWWTGDGQTDRFSYAVAISTSNDPWQVDTRLPVSGPQSLADNLVHVQDFRRLAGMVYAVPEEGP